MSERRQLHWDDDRGFTLGELLVTVLIIAILTAVAHGYFLHQRRKGWMAQVVAATKNMASVQEWWVNTAGNPSYTPALADLAAVGYTYSENDVLPLVVAAAPDVFCLEVSSRHDDSIVYHYDSTVGYPEKGPAGTYCGGTLVASLNSGGGTGVAGRNATAGVEAGPPGGTGGSGGSASSSSSGDPSGSSSTGTSGSSSGGSSTGTTDGSTGGGSSGGGPNGDGSTGGGSSSGGSDAGTGGNGSGSGSGEGGTGGTGGGSCEGGDSGGSTGGGAHPSGKDRTGSNGKGGDSSSDPDGDENGGSDKPGGDGGANTGDQDGNNGSGNDDDFEDDNNGPNRTGGRNGSDCAVSSAALSAIPWAV